MICAQKFLFLLSISCVLIVCCSCQKRPRRIVYKSQYIATQTTTFQSNPQVKDELSACSSKKSASRDDILVREAELADIPIPPKARSLSGEAPIIYSCEQNRASLLSFYKQQMANFGWRMQGEMGGSESLLLFKKPDRNAVISVRTAGKHSNAGQQLVITVLKKEPRS